MENRLKKERNRLFRRVILILTAVWLAVSSAWWAVCLLTKLSSIDNTELGAISYMTHQLSSAPGDLGGPAPITLSPASMLSYKEREPDTPQTALTAFLFPPSSAESNQTCRDFDSQLAIFSIEDGRLLADTAFTFGVRFGLKDSSGVYVEENGYLSAQTFSQVFSEQDLRNIRQELERPVESGFRRKLICTRFFRRKDEFVPLEIAVALLEEDGDWLLSHEFTKILPAADTRTGAEPVYTPQDIRQNSIPDAFLYGTCQPDLMATLSSEQLGEEVLLCLMIWTIIRAQMVEEQKRTEMTNALAHDMKTPLFVINGYAYSLKEDIDPQERGDYIDRIIEQTEEIDRQLHRMLELGKLDSYQVTPHFAEYDLFEQAEQLLVQYARLPQERTITLSHRGKHLICADRDLIDRCLKNLPDNAVKYSPPQSVIHIEIIDRTLRISNQSEPMSKADLRQIWQPYVRKDKSRHQRGTGLGLSIVRSILDLHGLRYGFSMNGDLLTFTVTFRDKRKS